MAATTNEARLEVWRRLHLRQVYRARHRDCEQGAGDEPETAPGCDGATTRGNQRRYAINKKGTP